MHVSNIRMGIVPDIQQAPIDTYSTALREKENEGNIVCKMKPESVLKSLNLADSMHQRHLEPPKALLYV